MILPSLLEYSSFSLEQKLLSVLDNLPKFQSLSGQTNLSGFNQKTLHLHLDFVLEQFAKDRSVMQSLGLEAVFAVLREKISDQNLNLTVHLMGENEDWPAAFQFWTALEIPLNWQIDLFVPVKLTKLFSFDKANCQTWFWFDFGQWENLENRSENELKVNLKDKAKTSDLEQDTAKISLESNLKANLENQILETQNTTNPLENLKIQAETQENSDLIDNLSSTKTPVIEMHETIQNLSSGLNIQKSKVLLMTVQAGVSGQKMSQPTKQAAFQVVKDNPHINFVLDGGWQVDDHNFFGNLNNVDLVSYSSFWHLFES